MMVKIAVNGIFMCIVCLAQKQWNFLGIPMEGENAEAISNTVIFTLFVLFQLFNAFNCRELGDRSVFPNFFRNKLMLVAFVAAFALQVVITQFAGPVFDTVPLGILDWLKIVALAFSVILLDEAIKLVRRAAKKSKANG